MCVPSHMSQDDMIGHFDVRVVEVGQSKFRAPVIGRQVVVIQFACHIPLDFILNVFFYQGENTV